MIRSITIILCLCLSFAFAAHQVEAQNPQPAPPGVVPAPVAPPNAPSPLPEQIAPPGKDAITGDRNLSGKLSQQNGMLESPHSMDPDMTIAPPVQGQQTMRVIPPLGSPGGNQRVAPK